MRTLSEKISALALQDEQLLREALAGLEWALGFVDPEDGPPVLVEDIARARAAITKLEQRLLNE